MSRPKTQHELFGDADLEVVSRRKLEQIVASGEHDVARREAWRAFELGQLGQVDDLEWYVERDDGRIETADTRRLYGLDVSDVESLALKVRLGERTDAPVYVPVGFTLERLHRFGAVVVRRYIHLISEESARPVAELRDLEGEAAALLRGWLRRRCNLGCSPGGGDELARWTAEHGEELPNTTLVVELIRAGGALSSTRAPHTGAVKHTRLALATYIDERERQRVNALPAGEFPRGANPAVGRAKTIEQQWQDRALVATLLDQGASIR